MRVRCGYATAHLGDGSGRRSHVFPVDENVHGVVAAPLHAHAVPDLSNAIEVHVYNECVASLTMKDVSIKRNQNHKFAPKVADDVAPPC